MSRPTSSPRTAAALPLSSRTPPELVTVFRSHWLGLLRQSFDASTRIFQLVDSSWFESILGRQISKPLAGFELYPALVRSNRTGGREPVSSNREVFYSGKPTFFRRAFTRGSSRTNANSGLFRVKPSRTGPTRAKLSNRSIVWSLSPNPAKTTAN